MTTITVTGLTLQFDVEGDVEESKLLEVASQCIDIINGSLQREPYGMGAQILTGSGLLKDQVSFWET